jgi:hypothetical protein
METMIYLVAVIVFFLDPIRRWNFFGYRPTAVMVLFDPNMQKFLLAKVSGVWSFNQGGIYENNMYFTVNDILKRELGISETRFRLLYTKLLGTTILTNTRLLARARISTISMFRTLRGKGYLACFIHINLKDIEREIVKGAGVEEVKIVGAEEAKELVKQLASEEHRIRKQTMILEAIDEVQKFAAK